MKRGQIKPGTKRLTSTTELARGTPLQRGQPLQAGTSQLKRTQLRPSQGAPNRAGQEQLRDKHPATPRRPALKSRGPKMTKIRRSARNQECQLNFPVCNHDSATTAWCHSNNAKDGKGMALKARDHEGCDGCSACHAFYDGGYANVPGWTRDMVEARFDAARAQSQARLRAMGLMPPDAPTQPNPKEPDGWNQET